jgi:hypothetical protein
VSSVTTHCWDCMSWKFGDQQGASNLLGASWHLMSATPLPRALVVLLPQEAQHSLKLANWPAAGRAQQAALGGGRQGPLEGVAAGRQAVQFNWHASEGTHAAGCSTRAPLGWRQAPLAQASAQAGCACCAGPYLH